jgi:hypothetical protein
MSNKCVIFFSRDYQAQLFPLLDIPGYISYHVTLTRKEKSEVLKNGGKVIACLEEVYNSLPEAEVTFPYLKFSWGNDRFLKNYRYEVRLQIQKKIIYFWRTLLEEKKPIAVINEPVAIELSEILYIECERLGIRYLALSSYLMQDKVLFQYSPLNASYGDSLKDVVPSQENTTHAANLINQIREGFFKPSYVKNIRSRYSFINLYKDIRSIFFELIRRMIIRDSIVIRVCYGDYLNHYTRKVGLTIKSFFCFNRYNKYGELPKGVKIAFYPLHYEPEAVTLYCSYFNYDQDHLIRDILRCLPENYILVVKEHPNQPGALLENRFLSIRKDFPNLFLLPSEIPSRKIISECDILLTLGSSAGYEALAIGKRVINFGKVYYDSFEGVINIETKQELYNYFRSKSNSTTQPEGDLVDFTAKIFAQMKKGNPFIHNALYSKENLVAIGSSIVEELDK